MIRREIFDEVHADMVTSYNYLALVYNSLGEHKQARELQGKALVIRQWIFGKDHADVATSYSNLATVYNTLGEYNQAKESHKTALMIRKKIFGEDHAHVATSYNNQATTKCLAHANEKSATKNKCSVCWIDVCRCKV